MSKEKTAKQSDNTITVPFTIHPRAFKALGADLVTNDVVAIIELVKNAYDAYATEVQIRFTDGNQILEIEDNGSGMDRSVIEEAWCKVATPYRTENPIARKAGKRNRRTSGAKGLGRLSAARLGTRLEMVTQVQGGQCWIVRVDWEELAQYESIDKCVVTISLTKERPFKTSGTRLRISPLKAVWSEALIEDLRDNLARLLPPFETNDSFKIRLVSKPDLFEKESIDVTPPAFLLHPKYAISGNVSAAGKVQYTYKFNAVKGEARRTASGAIGWNQIRNESNDPNLETMNSPEFGPFTFEIRGWDIGQGDTQEIAERFDLRKASIRQDIRAYKGVSVYRDNVLVLPKSEGARDWLGLDLRRVGRVGPRLSTTQLIGYVAISSAENAQLEDTSDRERLASTPAVIAFEETLRAIIERMEQERDKDRRNTGQERKITGLFKELSAKELVSGVAAMAKEGGSASEALPLVEEFSDGLDKARDELEFRFVYYSRLATVGTIAHMLIHEVRNRTTALDHAFEWLGAHAGEAVDEKVAASKLEMGRAAISALDKLANTFAPLANRQFKRRTRSACIEESIRRCLLMLEADLKNGKIDVSTPKGTATEVAVDPGELDAILLNLLSNSVYWLAHKGGLVRKIALRITKAEIDKRVSVEVQDSGPGITEEEAQNIFWPGVTNKPGGIGMGLTVASELVAEYEGKLKLHPKGKLGGATFLFDLPIK